MYPGFACASPSQRHLPLHDAPSRRSHHKSTTNIVLVSSMLLLLVGLAAGCARAPENPPRLAKPPLPTLPIPPSLSAMQWRLVDARSRCFK